MGNLLRLLFCEVAISISFRLLSQQQTLIYHVTPVSPAITPAHDSIQLPQHKHVGSSSKYQLSQVIIRCDPAFSIQTSKHWTLYLQEHLLGSETLRIWGSVKLTSFAPLVFSTFLPERCWNWVAAQTLVEETENRIPAHTWPTLGISHKMWCVSNTNILRSKQSTLK